MKLIVDQGHINNLYNTTFWALIQQGGMDAKTAEKELAVSFLVQYYNQLLILAGDISSRQE
jgi:tRNA(His) 5'-end guanylyltransferase